ncbi:MAG: hypothetical protein AAF211_23780 [Myxococcota bacterium]
MSTTGPTANHAFHCHDPFEDDARWWFVVEGQLPHRFGPFGSEVLAVSGQHAEFRRWAERARARGGWAWLHTHRVWVVTLPVGVPCGGVAFEPGAVSHHGRGG